MERPLIPAVILSCHTMGLAVIRSLGEMGVPIIAVYYEKNDMGYVSKFVKNAVFAPHPEKNVEQFIELLISISKQFEQSILIPADDATLCSVSKNKKELEQYYLVACPEWEITKKFIDKKVTYEIADKMGIVIPETLVPQSVEDVKIYGEKVQYPCLVKPCQSHKYFERYNKKVAKVNNLGEMILEYQRAVDADLDIVLQEVVPGDDTHSVNYNSYFWDGNPIAEFTAEKVRLSPAKFGVPSVVKSKIIPEIIEPGRKILSALGFYGFSCTEFKKDRRDGNFKLLDINGRHNRSALLSVRCGINFPWIEYKHLVYGLTQLTCYYQTEKFWIDEFRDPLYNLNLFKKKQYSFRKYLNPYLKNHTFAVFDRKDLKPFIKRIIDSLVLLVKKVTFFIVVAKN